MVYDYKLIVLGNGRYIGEWKHGDKYINTLVEASCMSDAKTKIVTNFKQRIWMARDKYAPLVPRSEFIPTIYDIIESGNKNNLKIDTKIADDIKNNNEIPLWEIKEVDVNGTTVYQPIKHDKPLMTELEAKKYILAQQFK